MGLAAALSSPVCINPTVLPVMGTKGNRKSKFRNRRKIPGAVWFSLIPFALEIGLSSEGKFSEIASLAPPQALAGLAQQRVEAPPGTPSLGTVGTLSWAGGLGPGGQVSKKR